MDKDLYKEFNKKYKMLHIERPLVSSHSFNFDKCSLKDFIPEKSIYKFVYSYDDIRINLPLYIYIP